MSSNTYGYTPEQMDTIGKQLVAIKGEIDGKITEAQNAVNGLIGSGFTTAVASGAYSEQFQALSTGLKQVSDNMEPLGKFLSQYAQAVVEMDNQMGSALRG
ncbi:MAG: WXG100 family type VII secretion target [Propionicimonas sp.]|uniref:WXG100 family type VII secretion target n=1 Tax=Propionicimonas sp. TaxID=1955623 RepID=UPI003D12BAA2